MKESFGLVIAEDDPVVAAGMKGLLEEAGHRVLGTAASAGEAVSMTRALSPDVLILDLELGDTDGLDAARALMAACPTPIVVCTAYADTELFSRAAEAGVSAYLVKPFRLSELMASIALSYERFALWCCDRPRRHSRNYDSRRSEARCAV